MLGKVYFWKSNVKELSFATAEFETPTIAFKSSIESKNIDEGINVKKIKKAIAKKKKEIAEQKKKVITEQEKKAITEKKKKNASSSDSEEDEGESEGESEGEDNEEIKHVIKEKSTHQDNKNNVNG